MLENDDAEIGVALCGFGALFTLFGVVMFFNNGLMAIGNVGLFFRRPACAVVASFGPLCKRAATLPRWHSLDRRVGPS